MEKIIRIELLLFLLLLTCDVKGQEEISVHYNIPNADLNKIAFPISMNDSFPSSQFRYDSTYYFQSINNDTMFVVFKDIHRIDNNKCCKSYSSFREGINTESFTQILNVKKKPSVIIVESSGWTFLCNKHEDGSYTLTDYQNTNTVNDSIIIDYLFKDVKVRRKDYPLSGFSIFAVSMHYSDSVTIVYNDTVIWEKGELLYSIKNSLTLSIEKNDWTFIGSVLSTKEKMLKLELLLNDYINRKDVTVHAYDN